MIRVTFRTSVFMVMVVKTVPGNGEVRGSGLALLLGYLGDGIETH